MLGRKGEGEVPLGLRRDVTEKACSWVFVSGEPGHAGDKSICRLELVRAGDKGGEDSAMWLKGQCVGLRLCCRWVD